MSSHSIDNREQQELEQVHATANSSNDAPKLKFSTFEDLNNSNDNRFKGDVDNHQKQHRYPQADDYDVGHHQHQEDHRNKPSAVTSETVIVVDNYETETNEIKKKQQQQQQDSIGLALDIPSKNETSAENQQQPKLPFDMNHFLQKVFALMFIGLLVTAGVSFIAQMQQWDTWLMQHSGVFIFLLIFEVIVVFALVIALPRLNYKVAAATFFLYAFLNGITITPIVRSYTPDSVALAFVTTSVLFLSMALYGYFTKSDLTSYAPILFGMLMALIVATLLNIFLGSTTLQLVICCVGILVFSGLTAYDLQTLKQLGERIGNKAETDESSKIAVIGALNLYLDFINLFLYILQLLGKSNN